MTELVTSLDQHFEHRDHDLVYDVYGDGPDTVLYLHGLLMDSDLNRAIARSLAAQGHRVLLLDLLGHGRSAKPNHASEYRMDAYADQAAALLDHLGVHQAVFGGVSLGANVSLLAATRHPDRVRGLVLEMPVLEWAVPAAAMAFTPLLLLAHYARGPMRLVTRVANALPRMPVEALDSALSGLKLQPEVIAAVLHGILVGPVAPTAEERRAIAVPALVMAHTNDLIHPFSDAENLARMLPRATLVRSWSALEMRVAPRRLTGEVSRFLDDLRTQPVSSTA